jgi:hypothetical protein
MVPQLVKKFHTLYRNRRFITVFTTARQLSLKRTNPVHSPPPPTVSRRCQCTIVYFVSFKLLRTIPTLLRFYGEALLAPRPTSGLEDHLLSAVRNCFCLPTIPVGRLHRPQCGDAPCRRHVTQDSKSRLMASDIRRSVILIAEAANMSCAI